MTLKTGVFPEYAKKMSQTSFTVEDTTYSRSIEENQAEKILAYNNKRCIF